MTKDKFMSFYTGTAHEKGAEACYDAVSKSFDEAGISSPLTLVGALATVRVEVGKSFKPIKETYVAPGRAFVGAQYEGRLDLGNTQVGDGARFAGRGLIQITGRANYFNYGEQLGIDLVGKPDLALDLITSARILASYFKGRQVNKACEARDWTKVRKLVNGGTNGLNDFLSIVNQYLKVL